MCWVSRVDSAEKVGEEEVWSARASCRFSSSSSSSSCWRAGRFIELRRLAARLSHTSHRLMFTWCAGYSDFGLRPRRIAANATVAAVVELCNFCQARDEKPARRPRKQEEEEEAGEDKSTNAQVAGIIIIAAAGQPTGSSSSGSEFCGAAKNRQLA